MKNNYNLAKLPKKPPSLNTIDTFDLFTSYLFAYLYNNFPLGADIDPLIFYQKYKSEEHESSKEHIAWMEAITCSSMNFLRDEGYINFETVEGRRTRLREGVVLTSKSLHKLKSSPPSLKTPRTSGEQFVELLSKTRTTLIDTSIKAALLYIFTQS